MSLVVVWVLTVLAAVVVVLTRLRLGGDTGGAGATQVPPGVLHTHTVVGGLALLTWVVYLVAAGSVEVMVGAVSLGLWWITALAGLLILVRWLPAAGRHAAAGTEDRWSRGPWLSLLAHLGMALGVGVFTLAYLTAAV